ncbi:ankyrin repeat domain-containing protein [Thalassotalea maritima]|uniref:ankyrin repeat domain-containing protein n=1 Tax=Thalassotalea maritima TaxID=3242416 RepID=UPI003529913F
MPRILSLIVFILLAGCSKGGPWVTLDESEAEFQKRVSQTVLIYMDLETMFPDDSIRMLARAAGKGDINKVRTLVKSGVDVNGKGSRNATPLFWAMRNTKGFKTLLELGANPNIIYGDGSTVFHWLTRRNDITKLKLALAYGSNPNIKASLFSEPAFFETVQVGKNKGASETFYFLISNGADIEATNENGQTLLLVAATLARYDYVIELLKLGANPYIKDEVGRGLKYHLKEHEGAFISGSNTEKYMNEVINFINNT